MTLYERITDPRLWTALRHPLVITMIMCVAIILASSGVDFLFIVINKVLITENPELAIEPVDRSLKQILINIAWVSAFSIGLLGSMTTVLDMVRNRVRRVTDFSAMSELSDREHESLSKWLTKGDTSVRNLGELWGEKEDDDG